jgi:glyoxylase-like metal-dependent hydrolase (beta-lactamase superfamily II)
MRTVCLGLFMPALLVAAVGRDSTKYVRIEKLSDRVVLAYWPGIDRRCNLTAIRSQKGLVIIDTEASPRVMAPIKEKIEQVFGRDDWAYVINTHAHDNHCSGNCLFKGATIVGHNNLPEDMQWLIRRQIDPDWKRKEIERYNAILRDLRAALPRYAANRIYADLIRSDLVFYDLFVQDIQEGYEVVKPTLMFADKHTLDLGDLTLELIFFGKGHSNSDILIYIPQEKLLVTGSIVYQRAQLPEIGEQSELQDVQRYLSVLDFFLADDVQINHLIPSHSPLLRKSDMVPVRDYYIKLLSGVQAARKEGLNLEQVIDRFSVRRAFPNFREPQPGHWDYGMQERNIRNLWRILNEQEKPPQVENHKN